MLTCVTGIDESAGSPSEPGTRPRATSSAPSAATIAPLSVHSAGRGTRRVTPASSHLSCARARSREFAQHLGKQESDLSGHAGWFFKRKFAGRLS